MSYSTSYSTSSVRLPDYWRSLLLLLLLVYDWRSRLLEARRLCASANPRNTAQYVTSCNTYIHTIHVCIAYIHATHVCIHAMHVCIHAMHVCIHAMHVFVACLRAIHVRVAYIHAIHVCIAYIHAMHACLAYIHAMHLCVAIHSKLQASLRLLELRIIGRAGVAGTLSTSSWRWARLVCVCVCVCARACVRVRVWKTARREAIDGRGGRADRQAGRQAGRQADRQYRACAGRACAHACVS
jgi:hypothetical protein